VTAPRGPRDGSDSRGMNIPLSPLLLGSLIAAGVGTVLLIAFLIVQFQADPPKSGPSGPGQPPNDRPPPLPPPGHMAFIAAMAIFGIAWLAVIASAARDQLMRRINLMEARIIELTTEYGEHRRTDGFVEGMAEATRPTSPSAGGPDTRLRSVPPPPQ
jgi:hypothetical protein